jgi:ABC-type glycerol-3-phosphate transport system substrate-binding protein
MRYSRFGLLVARYAVAGGLLAGVAVAGGVPRSPGSASAASTTTLTFYDGGLYSDTVMHKVALGYQKIHPNITVKIIPYSGSYVTDISTALAGGTAADVVVPTAMQQTWTDVSKGYYQDLTPYAGLPDPYLPNHETLAQALVPGTLDAQRYYDGRLYDLSTTSVDCAFYYNKNDFAQAGIKGPPATWDQLMADFKLLKQAGFIPFEAPLGDTGYSEPMLTLLSSIESMVMAKTIKKLDTNGNGTVDIKEYAQGLKNHVLSAANPEYQEAMRLYAQLYPWMERGAAGVNYANAQTAFIKGRGAVYFNGLWGVASVDSGKPAFKYGFFAVPQVTSASSTFATPGYHGTGAWGSTGAIAFSVPTTTAKRGHLSLAIDFMQYLMNYQNTDTADRDTGEMGVLKGMANDPRFGVFADISAHLSPVAFAEETMPPQYTVQRQQLLIDYLTGQKGWNDMLGAMQKGMDAAATQVLTTYHLK